MTESICDDNFDNDNDGLTDVEDPDCSVTCFELAGQGMGWSLCEDGVEGHVGGQPGFGGTMIFKGTDQGAFGILVMTNVGAVFLEHDARIDWYQNFYFEIEQLLFRTAEEMILKPSDG